MVLQGVRRVQHPGIAAGSAGVVLQYCRGSRGRSLPELQGVWGAQSSGIAGGWLAARGPRGATTRNCRGFEGAAPPELQAIQGAQVPGIAITHVGGSLIAGATVTRAGTQACIIPVRMYQGLAIAVFKSQIHSLIY